MRSFFPWPLLPCLLFIQYVERLESFHDVPPEDQMHVVDSPMNAICMKDSWHKYVTRGRAAILLVRSLEQDYGLHSPHEQVPNKFFSKEDIRFTPKGRFKNDGQPSDLLRREDESYDDGQSEPSPPHPRFRSEEEYQPPASSPDRTPPPERLPTGSARMTKRPLRRPSGSMRKNWQSRQRNEPWRI